MLFISSCDPARCEHSSVVHHFCSLLSLSDQGADGCLLLLANVHMNDVPPWCCSTRCEDDLCGRFLVCACVGEAISR